MSLIKFCFLHSTSVLSFYIDVFLALSIDISSTINIYPANGTLPMHTGTVIAAKKIPSGSTVILNFGPEQLIPYPNLTNWDLSKAMNTLFLTVFNWYICSRVGGISNKLQYTVFKQEQNKQPVIYCRSPAMAASVIKGGPLISSAKVLLIANL